MCLAIPMKIIEIKGSTGIAEVGGVAREINIQLIEELKIGDYVIVHAGFAIQKLDEKEARETLSLLKEISSIK